MKDKIISIVGTVVVAVLAWFCKSHVDLRERVVSLESTVQRQERVVNDLSSIVMRSPGLDTPDLMDDLDRLMKLLEKRNDE